MKPVVVAESADGAQAWMAQKNSDGTYSGYILEPGGIRREVSNLRTILVGKRWTLTTNGKKLIKPPKASEPKIFNDPTFDAPFRKAPKPKTRKKK